MKQEKKHEKSISHTLSRSGILHCIASKNPMQANEMSRDHHGKSSNQVTIVKRRRQAERFTLKVASYMAVECALVGQNGMEAKGKVGGGGRVR